jgi:hypothetical protein
VVEFNRVYFLTHQDVLLDSHFPDKLEHLLATKNHKFKDFTKTLANGYASFYNTILKYGLTYNTRDSQKY